jgi:ATP-dependent helicase/nuclease subunit B
MRATEVHAEAAGAQQRSAAGSVFTVPSGQAFLPAVARAILGGHLPRAGGRPPQSLDLPEITILLPSRRAVRALHDAFLEASSGRALLLPRIRPVVEGEEDLSLLSTLAAREALADADSQIPPAVSEVERLLVLTKLVLRWSETMRDARIELESDLSPFAGAGARTPAQAAHLAGELARLIDMVEMENASLSGLAGLVPDSLSEHWQSTLRFLEIALAWWPQHLVERALISAMDRRNRLILAEAKRLAEQRPLAPVIVAGVNRGIPATVELMRAVAALNSGAIVLPGLDQRLDDESWQAILDGHPEHPQHGLRKLLAALGIDRNDVGILPGTEPDPDLSVRSVVVSEALRPAVTTDRWHEFAHRADRTAVRDALSGITCLEAPTAQDEAEAIALILREALETPGQTAALVSPDRLLARRVAIRLESWGIRIDDSAGRPFAKTVPGTFLSLVIEAASRGFAPVALMALLKHPLTRFGLRAAEVRRAARALELAAFRTAYLGQGVDGVETALERAAREMEGGARRHRAVRRMREDDWRAARDLVLRLKSAFAPLDALFRDGRKQPLRMIAAAHVEAAEVVTRLPADGDASEQGSPLWQDEAGEAASLFFTGLLDPSLHAPDLTAAEYPELYRALIAGLSVRPRVPLHPRLSIWGLLEARLQQPDVIILGSLNEGTWPAVPDPGPWLNRPMRQALGLPLPEEQIGCAAHDFTQLLGARRVYLTRSQKIEGVPTVPSRWLLRLKALLDGMGLPEALASDRPWLAWARARDMVPMCPRLRPPEPRPAIKLRPRSLSATDIEMWIANPYTIFARNILGLEPLPALGQEPDAALRGGIVHEALRRFARRFPDRLPADPRGELLAIGEALLAEYAGNPRIAAFWVPRFERFAHWFAETERNRRAGADRTLAEVSGAHVLAAPAGPFTLKARADRIDVREDGLIITDYKMGTDLERLARRALGGESPQLPLEAMIAMEGGFADLPRARVATLRYISTSGGEPSGDEVTLKAEDIAALANEARDGLQRLIGEFDQEATAYRAVRRARFDYKYDGFAHLARVAEWSSGRNEEE